MKQLLKMSLLPCLLLSAALAFTQDQNSVEKYKTLLGFYNTHEATNPELAPYVDAIPTVIRRYCFHPELCTASEEAIVEGIEKDMNDSLGTGKGSKDELGLKALLAGKYSPHQSISAMRTVPKVKARTEKIPGGKQLGVVQVVIDGQEKRIFEIYSADGKFSAQQRAEKVADRITALQKRYPLWTMVITDKKLGNEWAVACPPAGSTVIVTANAAFARAQGVSEQQLGALLIKKIRLAFDKPSTAAKGDDPHDDAVQSREQGDDIYSTDADGAEKCYLSAISQDPNYALPYLRLAALYKEKSQNDKAQAILQQGLHQDGMASDDKADLEQAIKS